MSGFNKSELISKIASFFADDEKAELRRHIEQLDELNLTYFAGLLEQKKSGGGARKLRLFDGDKPGHGSLTAYPTAIAPPEMLAKIPYKNYSELKERLNTLAPLAAKATVWVKKTQAGGGTSILRTRYLSERFGIPENKVKLGAKGTDLFVDVPGHDKPVSLAEVQIFQCLAELERKSFARILFQDIVSDESRDAVRALWKKVDKKHAGFKHNGETFQSLIPTLNSEGKLTLRRKAPGGHALFAVDALLAAADPSKLPKTDGPLISVIGNGEDLGSTPDAAMIGWVLESKAPITMITTEKTENDLKGGQIAVVEEDNLPPYVALIEQAQAKEAGQLQLFEDLGLNVKRGNQTAFFNTNVAVFNYEALVPKIEKLVAKIGRDEFLKAITPTLIENKKTQKDADGAAREYEQLEGAMGSTILNLDKSWRRLFNEPLVSFINVERQFRSTFFSPVKTAFDFFMLFYSDRFSLDPATFRLVNKKPGKLPFVSLSPGSGDPSYYSEAATCLRAFEKCGIVDLDSLFVSGPAKFSGVKLKGEVRVNVKSTEPVDFSKGAKPSNIFENCTVDADRDKITVNAQR